MTMIQARAASPQLMVSKPEFDMWSSIQKDRPATVQDQPPPYVHPMMRRSASSLSQKSLEVCTESLGSETGSDGCLFSDDCFSDSSFSSYNSSLCSSPCHSPAGSVAAGDEDEEEVGDEYEDDQQDEHEEEPVKKELLSVNYHCSLGRRSPARSFPPPLPSISRRDGPCVQMRSHRIDGRLVLQAVPVPSQNYLHCRRGGGRLLLTFIEPAFEQVYPAASEKEEQEQEDVLFSDGTENEEVTETEDGEGDGTGRLLDHINDYEYDDDDDSGIIHESEVEESEVVEEEEEVEVVDRGIVVEVKVSRQPQPMSGWAKVRRSSLVINKFVGGVDNNDDQLLGPAVEAADAGVVGAGHGIRTVAEATVNEGKEREEGMGKDNESPQEQLQGPPPSHHVPQPQRSCSNKWYVPTEASISNSPAAAAAAEEVVGGWGSGGRHVSPAPSQDSSRLLLFTSKNAPMNRQALLHQVWRYCRSDPHRPLFICQPCCIATS